jgi:Type VI secretion system VasI, EvfG, VC_A0118
MTKYIAFALSWLIAAPAFANTTTVCTFPTLPSLIVEYPSNPTAKPTVRVGLRPAVEVTKRDVLSQTETVVVDGYTFKFTLGISRLRAERDGIDYGNETGQCISLNLPPSASALNLSVPITGIPADQTDVGSEPAQNQTAEVADPVEAPPAVDKGLWRVSETTSAFDDSKTVVLQLSSTSPVRGQFGPAGPAILYLRCMENTTNAYIWMNDLFLADIQGFGRVEYRIDEQGAAAANMEVSTDNKALGLWSGGRAIPFIQELIGGEMIVFRVTPFNESPIEFKMKIGGLEGAVAPLREACGW